MKIIVTRHGETDWNAQKKIMGHIDIPLNETGIKQAEETKEKLSNEKIDLIICSTLKRAKETATIINKGRFAPIMYDQRIVERDMGEFEEKTPADLAETGFTDYYKNVRFKRAENIQDFFKRVYNFLDEIIEKCGDINILLVTHGGVSIPIACYFKDEIPKGSLIKAGLALGNCEIVTYEVDKKRKERLKEKKD